jgi:hypothetical protein
LLDWLARQFMDSGWSIKSMHRRIMLSSTYQLASHGASQAAEVDPTNRLLARQNRRRLEVEPIRDALLAVSDDLDLSLGGNLSDSDRKEKYSRSTEKPYSFPRRAIYLPVVRNRAFEMFSIFDYSESGVHLPQRPTTTVAHQALFMMNNPFVMQRAEAIAAELLKLDNADRRLDELYLRLYARPIRDAERWAAHEYLATTAEKIDRQSLAAAVPAAAGQEGDGADSSSTSGESAVPADATAATATPSHDPVEFAAWSSLCRVLLAANEFIYID